MPTASKRSKSSAKDGSGAGNATNETPVSSAENPSPPKKADGNTASTRSPKKQPNTGAPTADAADKANGPDHPSQAEIAQRALQKLHGESDKRINGASYPGKPANKGGFDPKSFNPRNQPKGPQMRRTQGKGG